MSGAVVPRIITSTTNAIKSDREPALWVTVGAGAVDAGAVTASGDGLADATVVGVASGLAEGAVLR